MAVLVSIGSGIPRRGERSRRGLVDVRGREGGYEVTHYAPRSACSVAGCLNTTREHKPVCPDHVLELPRAAALAAHPLSEPEGLVSVKCVDCRERFQTSTAHGGSAPAERCTPCRRRHERAGDRRRRGS